MEFIFPEKIRAVVDGLDYYEENIGLSGSGVWIFNDLVLKKEKSSVMTERQNKMLSWLKGKLPVPEIICEDEQDGFAFTLMTRIRGEMSCAEINMLRPAETVAAVAEGIFMLQSVKTEGCPVRYTLDSMLNDAEKHISAADRSGWKGHFAEPEKQLYWLRRNMPEDDPVFAHGDYCMPNVMIENGHVCGFIDMAQCGAADRWYDIALMQQSLERNFSGYFGGRPYSGFRKEMLYDALGFSPDRDRLEFHLLLDELYSI